MENSELSEKKVVVSSTELLGVDATLRPAPISNPEHSVVLTPVLQAATCVLSPQFQTGSNSLHSHYLPDPMHLRTITPAKWHHAAAKHKQGQDESKISCKICEFSEFFLKAIGNGNHADVFGVDDIHLLIELFAALVEKEGVRRIRDGEIDIRGLHSQHTGKELKNFDFDVEGTLRWTINWGQTGTTLLNLIGIVLNIPRLDSIATLSSFLGMNFENLYRLSSETHVAETRGSDLLYDRVVRQITLPMANGFTYARLVGLRHILGNAGQSISAIALYEFAGRAFCLPATVGRGELSIGKYRPTALFLNQDQMDAHPSATVVFCQDMRTALALQNLFEQTLPQYRPQVIITAHLGTDLSVLPWGYFYGHDVVFICAPTKWAMAMVKGYKDQVLGAGAKSFKIFKWFLLHSSPSCDLADEVEGVSEAEAELLRRAIVLANVERPSKLVKHIARESLPYTEFICWGQDLELFKRPKKAAQVLKELKVSKLRWFDPSAVEDFVQPTKIDEVTAQHIVPPQGIVMLHGVKNAGKSNALFGIIRSLVHDENAFGFFPTERRGNHVLLVDSETPQELFKARLQQHQLTGAIGRNFFPARKADLAASVEGACVLTNPILKKALANEIGLHSISHLVLDNLTTLVEPAKLYTQKLAAEVLDWAHALSEQGVTTILAHHSLDNAENPESAAMRGSREFSIRAHTEIVIIGTDQVRSSASLGSPKVQVAAKGQGATIGLHFKYCKMACIIERHTLWLHLALNGEQWKLLDITNASGQAVNAGVPHAPPKNDAPTCLDTLLFEPCPSTSPSLTPAIPTDMQESQRWDDLSENERAALEFAQSCNKIVQTGALAAHFRCGDTKAREILRSLCDKGILVPTGQGAASGYKLP